MSNFAPAPAGGVLQPCVYAADPRYTVGFEWGKCKDGVRRPRYKALFSGRSIGEIMPSYRRETVMADLKELIDDGGVGMMRDLCMEGVPND